MSDTETLTRYCTAKHFNTCLTTHSGQHNNTNKHDSFHYVGLQMWFCHLKRSFESDHWVTQCTFFSFFKHFLTVQIKYLTSFFNLLHNRCDTEWHRNDVKCYILRLFNDLCTDCPTIHNYSHTRDLSLTPAGGKVSQESGRHCFKVNVCEVITFSVYLNQVPWGLLIILRSLKIKWAHVNLYGWPWDEWDYGYHHYMITCFTSLMPTNKG